ncbi:MAG: hypoxanthine-guanine phosphoribosyltransferase [Gammaproteobacteria bacterium]|nr:hypoxanthine-guanine phosphoribosyltransferase [Gammaproteobacteria bacterium]
MLLNELNKCLRQAELVFSDAQIKQALAEQARKINLFLQTIAEDSEAPVMLPVMNGGLIYAGQLLPLITTPVVIDYIHATRYRNTTAGFELEWKVYPQTDLKNKVVIVLDDILDEGHTLDAIVNFCKEQGAASVRSSVLVTKQHTRRNKNIVADFSALDVPDRYVFGYGMDYKGHLRNLNGIYSI